MHMHPEEFWPTFGSRTSDQAVEVGVDDLDICVIGQTCGAYIFAGGPGDTYQYLVYGAAD